MMDREALTELLSKVEAGWTGNTEHDFMQLVYRAFGRYEWRIISAFRGDPNPAGGYHPPSLDAAKTLHETVLPGWTIANIGQDDGRLWWVELRKGFQTSYLSVAYTSKQENPACGWLICILKALISQTEENT